MSAVATLVMFGLVAILFVAIGVPLKRRKVRPNMLYGFRTAATLRDERLWYDVNERSGEDSIGIGLTLLALTGVLFVLELNASCIALTCTAWMLAGTVLMLAHGLLFIRQQRRS